ncbi:MAG: hypothetical protein ABJ056_10490 [Halioglobus sp.]
MLLRRITHHVNEQNWFAVALDFLIVVFGIWGALLVGQWTEDQQMRSDLARAEGDFNNEVMQVYYYAYERLAVAPCRKARYKELGDMLLNSDAKWPGAPGNYGGGILTRHRAFPLVVRSPSRPWLGEEWKTALNSGLLDTMNTQKRRRYSDHFWMTEEARKEQNNVIIVEARLQALFPPSNMGSSDRLRYYDILIEADARSARLELHAEQIIENIEANNLVVYDEEARLQASEFVADRNVGRVEIYGDCAKQVELPLLNKSINKAAGLSEK